MQLYFSITFALLIALLVSITDSNDNKELKRNVNFSSSIYKFLFISLILLFWFLTAFRGDSIGNDTKTYLNYYVEIAKKGVNSNLSIELGYQYFCLILSKISSNKYFLLIVCATICYSICGIYIYKYSRNILFSIILLFCSVFSFFASGVRQSIAMAIVLIAYFKIKEGKKLFPILLILFASVFHVSALIALLWFAHKYIPKKPLIVIALTLVISVLAALGNLNTLLASVFKEYESYFSSEYAGTGFLGIFYYALRASVFYLFIYIANKSDKKENSLPIANAVLLLFTVCLGFAVNLFNRASLYFLLVIAIDIPNAFNSGKIRNRDLWMLVMGLIMLAYFMVTLIIRPEWNNLYPYEFSWS